MPDKQTLERARADKKAGKAASTQAGEFVREEVEHIREGKHGARSAKQAIAIGLSKARRAGVELPPPKPGRTSDKARKQAVRELAHSHDGASHHTDRKRARATENALKRESSAAASSQALAKQAHSAATRRSPAERSEAARHAAQTKGAAQRSAAARKAAHTRQAHAH